MIRCKGQGCLLRESCMRFYAPHNGSVMTSFYDVAKGCKYHVKVRLESTIQEIKKPRPNRAVREMTSAERAKYDCTDLQPRKTVKELKPLGSWEKEQSMDVEGFDSLETSSHLVGFSSKGILLRGD